MFTRWSALALLLGSFLLGGCATGPAYNGSGQTMAAVQSGQGRIVFFRPSALGSVVQPDIRLDGQTVGTSTARGFFYADVLPGLHVASVTTEVTREATINVSAGQTEYVRTAMTMGVFVGHVSFEPVDAVTGLREVGELAYTGSIPLVSSAGAPPVAPSSRPTPVAAAASAAPAAPATISLASPSSVPPVTTTSATSAPPLKRGDELAYRLTDRMTRISKEILYHVDRVEGDRVVLNQGSRVERLNGTVVSLDMPVGGDMERMAPPEGWINPGAFVGQRWNLRYSLKDGGRALGDYRLAGRVVSQGKMVTPLGELDVMHVEYNGWVRRTDVTVSVVSYKLALRAWYAPALGRIVRFESDATPSSAGGFISPSREQIELVAIRRL